MTYETTPTQGMEHAVFNAIQGVADRRNMEIMQRFVGREVNSVSTIASNDEHADLVAIVLRFADGSAMMLWHDQDCCETVYIEDINGNWDDLIGRPLLVAEERSSGKMDVECGDEQWTFYTFRSEAGSVDVRWIGSSNGYYSTSVSVTDEVDEIDEYVSEFDGKELDRAFSEAMEKD